MGSKLIARIIDVQTSPVDGRQYISPVGGTLETIPIDKRWGATRVQTEMENAIDKRITNGILKEKVGYALYNSVSGGLRLSAIVLFDAAKHGKMERLFF